MTPTLFSNSKLVEDIVEDVLKSCPDDEFVKMVIAKLRETL